MEKGGIDMGMQKMFARGGENMDEQMEMFGSNIRLKDEGGEQDATSGNNVPLGGDKEGVRDDQEANISVGEVVVPADVVRYHGVEKFMALRDEAKMGYKKMEAMGQLGNSEEATLPDDTIFNSGGAPFSIVDMEVVDSDDDEVDAADGALIMAANGAVAAPTGNVSQVQTDPLTGQPIITTAEQEIAQEAGELATGVTGQTTQNVQQQPVVAASPVTQAAVPTTPQSTQGTLPQFSSFFGSGSDTFINQDGQQIVLPIGTPAPPGFTKKGENPERSIQPFPGDNTRVESPEEKLARERQEQAEEIRQNIPGIPDVFDPDSPSFDANLAGANAVAELGNESIINANDVISAAERNGLTVTEFQNALDQVVEGEEAFKSSRLGQAIEKLPSTGKLLTGLLGLLGKQKSAAEVRDDVNKALAKDQGAIPKTAPVGPNIEKVKADIAAKEAAQKDFEARAAEVGFDPDLGDVAQAEAVGSALGFDPQAALGFGSGEAKGGLISAAKGTLTTNQKKLDVDGDGVLKKEDFAALRASKKTNAMYGGLMKKKKKKKKSYVKGGLATPKK